jgi:hypothetical protein
MDLASLRRWWPFAAVVVLLGLAAVAAGHSALEVRQSEPALPAAPGAQEDFGEPVTPSWSPPPSEEIVQADPSDLPGWLGPLATVLCTATVLVVVGLVAWTLTRDALAKRRRRAVDYRTERAPPPRTADEVVAALDAGLDDLSDTDGDPRRAVIACWLRLEQAAAAAGTPKRVGDSPTDLVSRLLQTHEVSADVLAALAEVYREARYATHAVDERMRAQARAALQRIRAELTAGARA